MLTLCNIETVRTNQPHKKVTIMFIPVHTIAVRNTVESFLKMYMYDIACGATKTDAIDSIEKKCADKFGSKRTKMYKEVMYHVLNFSDRF
jgi:hypothetical protein